VSTAPDTEYRDRLRDRTSAHISLLGREATLSFLRLGVFAVFLGLGWLAWRGALAPGWITAPVVIFGWLVARHDGLIRQRTMAGRAIAFYERGLARIEDRWAGSGEPGDRFVDDAHLYANDLDLFGRGSLFELLSIARTRSGEETLAAWLKAPAPPTELLARRAAVVELAPALDLRECVAGVGADVRAGIHGDALVEWARSPLVLTRVWLRWIAAALSVSTVISVGWWAMSDDPAPFVIVAVVELLFSTPLRARVDRALHAADGPARDLDILAHVLGEIEARTFTASRLRGLREGLSTEGLAASAAIHRLRRLVEWHDWQHNPFFALIGASLLWGTQIAFAIEHWRHVHGRHVEVWLRSVAEFEALSSLSAYHYEHPDDPFAEIVETGPALYVGTGVGHPLIAAARMVRNDVRLDARGESLLVISGSNMSGKSTMLRTVGINAVLAFAGAPVRARSLRLTPLVVGATLRIQDSLQEGRSRFYAEITRVRQLADAAGGTTPLLFLLDELFHGTNSHDRLAGASGVLRNLVTRGAIGLITTHDLALTAIVGDLAPRAANVHFQDHFEGGVIQFDYRMKSGPVTRSNAIALMRAVGLDVDESVGAG
jgi:hypothetical protein